MTKPRTLIKVPPVQLRKQTDRNLDKKFYETKITTQLITIIQNQTNLKHTGSFIYHILYNTTINLSLCTPWRCMGGSWEITPFSTSPLDGSAWSASRPGRFTFGWITLGAHWLGVWVWPRAGLNFCKNRKLCSEWNHQVLGHSTS
jgi:hypothetical protein